jgi:hypothetical protein
LFETGLTDHKEMYLADRGRLAEVTLLSLLSLLSFLLLLLSSLVRQAMTISISRSRTAAVRSCYSSRQLFFSF